MNFNKIKASTIISPDYRSKDERGQIVSLCDNNIKNISYIYSKKNTIRSNHYHKNDWHLIYVMSGYFYYFCKQLNSRKINKFIIKKNFCVFTPPLEIHCTYFPVNTKLIVASKNKRDQKTYEKDTVRVNFINLKNLQKFINE
jgi:hypothetical protein